MNNDVTNLINHSATTALNIVQMAQYRIKYVQNRDAESKQKMIKYAVLACAGILSLFTIGILGLIGKRE